MNQIKNKDMKKCKRIVMMAISVVLFFKGYTQEDTSIELINIKSYAIEIGFSKTSNIVFPSKIVSVDRGSQAIILQKARGVENVLQLKAAKKRFPETNLTVITADGKFYSFLVNYSESPALLNVNVIQLYEKDASSILLNGSKNISLLEKEKIQIPRQHSFLRIRRTNQNVRLTLRGICLGEQSMWFSFDLKNKSFIDYNPTLFRFFIKDKRRSKRTAIQEQEVFPVYSNEMSTVNGLDSKSIAIAFAPFTIPSTKRLVITLDEEGGSRELTLRVKPKVLVKARPITR
jgi:conjugative transposon TraN protein